MPFRGGYFHRKWLVGKLGALGKFVEGGIFQGNG